MGIKVVIPGVVFTDTSLPKLLSDPILNAGSLMLVDLGRGYTAPLDVVPSSGALLGNLAWEQASALISGGTEDNLKATWLETLTGHGTIGFLERTAKQGIHTVVSQVAADGVDRYGGIAIPDKVREYAFANVPSRKIYWSIWGRTTRVATNGYDVVGHFAHVTTATSSYAMNFGGSHVQYPAAGGNLVGRRSVPGSAGSGNFYRNLAVQGWTGTKPGSYASTQWIQWFGQQGAYAAFQQNASQSGIIYRIYIEDLTASGRTYAEADAADKSLYDVAFGAGGRFAGDTFTSAGTLP